MTCIDRAQYIADTFNTPESHWLGKRVVGVDLWRGPVGARLHFADGTSVVLNGGFAADLWGEMPTRERSTPQQKESFGSVSAHPLPHKYRGRARPESGCHLTIETNRKAQSSPRIEKYGRCSDNRKGW